MTYDFMKEFENFWKAMNIQNHIVQSLKKSKNSKQAVELSQKMYAEMKVDIISDLEAWYRVKQTLDVEITEKSIKDDVLHRINGELAKYGVPLLSFDMLL